MASSRTQRFGAIRLAVVAFGVSAATIAGGAMAKSFSLAISGESGARYRGACTLMLASGDHTIDLDGAVPLERAFEGDGLSCRLHAEGQVTVEIAHDGSRSWSATNGGMIQISVR